MKKVFFFLFSLYTLNCFSQGNSLNFSFVNQHELPGRNDKLLSTYNQIISEIKNNDNNFNYSTCTSNFIDFTDSPNLFTQSTIGSMKAGNFILLNRRLSNHLIPLFIVKKQKQNIPYYNSYIIVNKNSTIDSLNSPEIKKIYYVDEKSSSGYFEPIYKLWELGIIKQPSLKSAREKFGEQNIIKAGSHENVIKMVSNDKSFSSIGLCGQIPEQGSDAQILLRYSLIPQDVIYVSQDLKEFIPIIKKTLRMHIENGMFDATNTEISGIEDFGLEYNVAYQVLSQEINRVQISENQSENKIFIYPNEAHLGNIKQLMVFLEYLSFNEFSGIIAFLFFIFISGITVGLKYPEIAKKIKRNKP